MTYSEIWSPQPPPTAVRFGTVRVMGETTTKKISPEDPELEVKTRSKGFGNLKEID